MHNINNETKMSPTLEGKGIKLVPFSREYLGEMFRWENDVSTLYLWTSKRNVTPELEYEQIMSSRLRNYYHNFLIILDSKNKPVGFIYSYEYDIQDGYIYVTIFIEQSSRFRGLGAKAGILFFDYLFAYFPIRKVYCDVFQYNKVSFSFLNNCGFGLEGTLKEHKYFNGEYHDMYKFGLFRDKFYSKSKTILKG